jgi:hypothetical protein
VTTAYAHPSQRTLTHDLPVSEVGAKGETAGALALSAQDLDLAKRCRQAIGAALLS